MRSQPYRGLELLRLALPASMATPPARGEHPRDLRAVRGAVLAAAGIQGGISVPRGATIVMKKLPAVCVVLSVAGLWLAWPRAEGAPPSCACRGVDLRGTVVDPDGRPVARAVLVVGPGSESALEVARSDGNGAFLVRAVAPRSMVAAFADGHGASQTVAASAFEHGPVELRLAGRPVRYAAGYSTRRDARCPGPG